MFDLLKTLCDIPAPSGTEAGLRRVIEEKIAPFVDECHVDALGNLIAHKKGEGKKLMFCAHMDEIGLVATCFGEKGQVYVSPLGGVSPQTALYQRVQFSGGATGVLVPGEPEVDYKNLKFNKLYVDMGAKNKAEAEQLVALGETAAFVGEFREQGDVILSKALDNRAGCCALLEAVRRMQGQKNDLHFVFTAGEELGLRGAKAAAYSVKPDFAIAVDVTRTGDVPSAGKMAVSLGEGVAVKLMDGSMIAHPLVKDRMTGLCREAKIPFQLEILERGGTDAGAVHVSGGGVPSGCVSIPTRYIHSPGEMIHKKDLEAAEQLIRQLIEQGIQ